MFINWILRFVEDGSKLYLLSEWPIDPFEDMNLRWLV